MYDAKRLDRKLASPASPPSTARKSSADSDSDSDSDSSDSDSDDGSVTEDNADLVIKWLGSSSGTKSPKVKRAICKLFPTRLLKNKLGALKKAFGDAGARRHIKFLEGRSDWLRIAKFAQDTAPNVASKDDGASEDDSSSVPLASCSAAADCSVPLTSCSAVECWYASLAALRHWDDTNDDDGLPSLVSSSAAAPLVSSSAAASLAECSARASCHDEDEAAAPTLVARLRVGLSASELRPSMTQAKHPGSSCFPSANSASHGTTPNEVHRVCKICGMMRGGGAKLNPCCYE